MAHALYYHTQLPPEVPKHFGASGIPTAWTSKTTYLWIQMGATGIMVVTFPGLAWLIPKMPDSMINVTHKEYWLAAERRAATRSYIGAQLLSFGSLTLLFLLAVFHQGNSVSLGRTQHMEYLGVSLSIYLILTAVWCVLMYARFRQIPPTS